MMIQSAKLNRRVQIQAVTETRNAFGETIKTWATVKTVWAAIKPLTGDERLDGQKVVSEVDTRITMRYQPNLLTALNRLLYCGKTYNVTAVMNTDEANHELIVLAKER